MQDADAEDEIAGPGLGFVDAFGTDGSFLAASPPAARSTRRGAWPWRPPAGSGSATTCWSGTSATAGSTASRPTSSGWEDRGHLKLTNHHPLVVDGLWGIGFGNDAAAGPKTSLYFAAGPDDESHGLFGSITAP